MNHLPIIVYHLLVGTVGGLALTGLAVWAARRLDLMAHPGHRSSHDRPTPQVGGVGVCLTLLFLILGLYVGDMREVAPLFWLVASGFVLGLWDDIRAMAAIPKLLGQLIPAALAAYLIAGLGEQPGETMADWFTKSPIAWVFIFCAVLFFINAFNFMDGTNGFAGTFTLGASVWLLLIWLSEPTHFHYELGVIIASITASLAGAMLGFLPWNFPRAQTFMGDCGSLPLGALLATLALLVSSGHPVMMIAAALPLLPFAYDVIYTLVRRSLRGANLLEAHREHLYQRLLIATGWSHARLLAFHLPFWIVCGLAGVVAGRMTMLSEAVMCAVAALVAMGIYTVLVRNAERTGAKS